MNHLPKTRWTVEQLTKLAKRYKKRNDFQKKQPAAYMSAYHRGILDTVCAHIPPTKKNRYMVGVFNFANAIGKSFSCRTMEEFRRGHKGAYDACLRNKVDVVELFEKRDDPAYLRELIISLGEQNKAKVAGK